MKIASTPRKKQITQIAQNMFREKGFTAASMRDIAKEVGIEPASLYSHFNSKEDILKNICYRIADEFFESFEPIQNSVSNPTEKLKRAVSEHINVIINNIDASAVFFNEWKHLNEPSISEFLAMRDRYEEGFRKVVEEGVMLCEFKNVDISFTVRLLFSVMNDVHSWYQKSGKVTPELVGEQIGAFILNGLATA